MGYCIEKRCWSVAPGWETLVAPAGQQWLGSSRAMCSYPGRTLGTAYAGNALMITQLPNLEFGDVIRASGL